MYIFQNKATKCPLFDIFFEKGLFLSVTGGKNTDFRRPEGRGLRRGGARDAAAAGGGRLLKKSDKNLGASA
jgi:hypothetical protein